MPQIVVLKRLEDASQARIVIDCKVIETFNCDKEKQSEMLLEAEMNGNSSGKVRVHFNGF